LLKNKRFHIIVLLLAVFITQQDSAQAAVPWALKKNEDGIKVHTRLLAEGGAVEFKATTNLQMPAEYIMAILTHTKQLPHWQAHLQKSKVLSRESALHWHEYSVLNVPWPLEGRDLVLSKKIVKGDGVSNSLFLYMRSVPAKYPQQNNLIRINQARGFWELAPQDNGEIRITYQFHIDPELQLPTWLLNMFTVEGPYRALKHLREQDAQARL